MALVNSTDVCDYPGSMSASESVHTQFEQLLGRHHGIVRKVAFSYANNESDRRDLMQEILLQLWKAFPRYSPNRRFSTWMYRIALNVAISWLRRNIRPGRQRVQFDESKHDLPHEQSGSPEMEERIAMLRELISKCQPFDRALLLLYLDECSYREIAAVLGLSETNVATKLSRLKEHLRQRLTTNA